MALVEAVERTPIDDSGPLSQHEADFSAPKRGDRPPVAVPSAAIEDDTAQETAEQAFQESQDPALRYKQPATRRPESHRASPEEVAKINELTKELRTKEAELVKLKPDAVTGSARLRTLQRQIKAVGAELAELQPQPVRRETPQSVPVVPSPAQTVQATAGAATFAEPKPKLEDFANEEDPYEAKVLAVARWERRKEAFESQQQQTAAQRAAAEQQQQQHWQGIQQSHQQRLNAALAARPDLVPRLQELAGRPSTLLMDQAIMTSDRSADIVLDFLQHPEVIDELLFSTYNLPVNDSTIAALQRRLVSRLQADSTAAASAPRQKTPPKPPTAVRTGPMSTGLEPPGDGASLAEHEAFFAKRRR